MKSTLAGYAGPSPEHRAPVEAKVEANSESCRGDQILELGALNERIRKRFLGLLEIGRRG